MVLIKEAHRWVARADYNDRHTLKACSWRWDPEDKEWWTDQEANVQALQNMSGGKLEVLEMVEEEIDLPGSYEGHPSCALDGPKDIPKPPGLDYMPFQRGGIAFARGREGVLVADDMGLGKTIQAIGMMNDEPIQRALIICPASLKLNWEKELDKWLNYYRKVAVVSAVWPKDKHIYIINYDILKRHKEAIDAVEWDILVCDESQYIKNPEAKRTQMVLGSKKLEPIKATRRVFLSGTPIENRPIELFAVINSLAPDVFPSHTDFAFRYCKGRIGKWGLEAKGASNLAELQFKLRENCMIRRMKKDVLKDLPDKIHQEVVFPCSGETRKAVDAEVKAYNAAKAALRSAETYADTEEGKEEYMEAQSNFRSKLQAARKKTTLAMLPMALDYLENALENGKVIVFSYHRDVMKAIKERFPDNSVAISGETPTKFRQLAVDRFQEDPDCRLFIGQIKAAGTGLTLTASSHVVFFERDFRPGLMSQAEDRAHRMGQKNSVLITNCVLEDSYDQEMLRSLASKEETIKAAMNA